MIDKELIHQAAEDIDIFEADLTEEFERLRGPQSRTIRLWPLAVAACVAGVAFILLMPPQRPPLTPPLRGEHMRWESLPIEGEVWRGSLEAQLAHQQEIKEKGERLAAYVRKYTKNEMQ